MPVGSHYFSWWYWYSIITYAYGHYFSGAINMCCDLGALDLTSHTCLLLAEACFKSVTSVFSRTNLVSLPSLTAPLKTRKFLFFLFLFHGSLAFLHGSLWPCWLEDGSHRGTVICTVPFFRSMGLPLKTCHFLYFCSLSPDTHEMQWSLQFVLMFFLFSKCKDRQNEINWIKVTLNRQSREKLPMPSVIQSNSETLHPMWGLSGFVFFYLRCLCSAISM